MVLLGKFIPTLIRIYMSVFALKQGKIQALVPLVWVSAFCLRGGV